jgi:hydrogenase maturation factor
VLVGQMLGEVPAARFVDKRDVRPGDVILLTKGVPVEGTAIMARECADRLTDIFSKSDLARARDFLHDPGISVLKEAMIACDAGEVHAMHDPTEGGVATALWELAQAADCGLRVRREDIPILAPGGAFCNHLDLDPLGTIASGAMLICAPESDTARIAAAVRDADIRCTPIGEVTDRSEGVVLVGPDGEQPMPRFDQDEITRLFA